MSEAGGYSPVVVTDLIGTYRVQLRPGFGFDEAASIADYLASLGVSHLYASPYLQAAPGSTHGYDVVDYGWVNAELGGADAHQRMTAALKDNGLGHVLDLVPNHMATGPENAWWWDVLQNGPSSRCAAYFDIDWHGPESRLRNKVLLPILDNHYGRVLEAGNIRLERSGAVFQVTAPGQVTPVTPDSLDRLLQLAAWRAGTGTAPPGGEAMAAVTRRVLPALDALLAAHPAGRVLVVSHVTPIKILLRHALLAPPVALWRMFLDVASVSEIDWYPDGTALVRSMNDTAHLTPAAGGVSAPAGARARQDQGAARPGT